MIDANAYNKQSPRRVIREGGDLPHSPEADQRMGLLRVAVPGLLAFERAFHEPEVVAPTITLPPRSEAIQQPATVGAPPVAAEQPQQPTLDQFPGILTPEVARASVEAALQAQRDNARWS